MSDFKEFQAKTLDQAIQDACQHFSVERIKLELEILEDAKSGIFGLVGARKARINARLVQVASSEPMNLKNDEPKPKRTPASTKPAPRAPKPKYVPVQKEVRENAETEENPVPAPRPQAKSAQEYDKRTVVKGDKRTNKFSREQSFEEDEEEDESQRKFLSKINPHDEELDENILAALDREAMARANVLGNMTEAEIRAAGHGNTNNRGRENQRPRNDNRDRNPRVRTERVAHDRVAGERVNNDRVVAERPRNDRPRNDRPRNDRDYGQNKESDDNKNVGERTFTPRVAPQKDTRREEALERKQAYELKRKQQREARPPKPPIVTEYDAPALPRIPLEELDSEKLITLTREIITKLIGPIVGFDVPVEVNIVDDRVHISIESEDTGLLIGREGQHLAAIQYLASRMLTRRMGSQIRIQVDTGDYHSRQDSRMEFLAHALADRVKASGRPQSTRPLSAYQRRVIHVALQDETEIQTRSCGDGTLKRVIIMRRRHPANKPVENPACDIAEGSPEVPEEIDCNCESAQEKPTSSDEFDKD